MAISKSGRTTIGDILNFTMLSSAAVTYWAKTFGGADQDYGSEVQQTADGGYIVIGSTKSFNNGVDDLYLIKTDNNGDTLWTKVYGGLWGDAGRSITEDINGNYLATGYTMSFEPGNADVWILKFNESGDTLWTKRVGGKPVTARCGIAFRGTFVLGA